MTFSLRYSFLLDLKIPLKLIVITTKMRLVGSMTTLPGRIDDISIPIKHILRQSVPLDCLYLNIPNRTMKGDVYNIPPNFLSQFNGYKTKVIINRCKDHGPITKLAPTLDIELDPSTYILTFDDDIIVHRHLVRVLRDRIKIHPNVCWALSGVCVGRFPFYFQFVISNEKDQCVDWIQGVHVVAYRRSFFTTCEELVKFRDSTPISKILVGNDDHHVSLYLARAGVLRVSIGKNIRDLLFSYKEMQEDALSANTNLYKDHYAIIRYALKKGYYKTNYSFSSSVIYILLKSICVGIFIAFFLVRKSWFEIGKKWKKYLFLPTMVVISAIVFKITVGGMILLPTSPLLLASPIKN